jgi:23S rRNA pseudouridine2605 synthase
MREKKDFSPRSGTKDKHKSVWEIKKTDGKFSTGNEKKSTKQRFDKDFDKRNSDDARPRRKNFDGRKPFRRDDDSHFRTDRTDSRRESSFERAGKNRERSSENFRRSAGTYSERGRNTRERDERSDFSRERRTERRPERRTERDFNSFRERPRFDREQRPRFDKPKADKPQSDEVRLNKFIANSGVCSRREADEYIVAGVITVNGEVVSTLGAKIKPGDDVRFNGERIKGERKVYILLNKPKDYITTVEDPHAKRTVMELIEGACTERVYPVGRLDRNSTGVLLFTNDGELTKQLTHPSYSKLKIYQVKLDKKLTEADLNTLLDGVELDDGIATADAVDILTDAKDEIGIEIHSGKNRVIRRMFEQLGYGVMKLDRVYFAGLTKKGLQRGHYRLLTDAEVNMLKIGAYK